MRYTQRFPLRLSVTVEGQQREYATETCDISAGGVLFFMDSDMPVDTPLRFSISVPGDILGAQGEVVVNCAGRVARCDIKDDRHVVAAVIDEYQFERT